MHTSEPRARRPGERAATERTTRSGGDGPSSRRLVFEALLHTGAHSQIVLGGRLCRTSLPTAADPTPDQAPGPAPGPAALAVHCATMPAGVLAMALLHEPERLLVTLRGGRRQQLAVGDAVVLP